MVGGSVDAYDTGPPHPHPTPPADQQAIDFDPSADGQVWTAADLAGQIGDSGVLSNACDHIEQIPGGAVLYVSVEVVNLGEALMY